MYPSFKLHLIALPISLVCYKHVGVKSFSPITIGHHLPSFQPPNLFQSSSKSYTKSLTSTANPIETITEFVTVSKEFTVEKPMGIILEEREENQASGVYCIIDESSEQSAAAISGIRTGDVLASIEGTDVTCSTFDEVMEIFANALSPVELIIQRKEERIKQKVVIQPKRMPSTKKLMKASTNVNFWKDPLMIGSAIITVALPLGVYLAASGPK
eukprot:CAMPEP_0204620008 /NCGR_PEP_ID=MMETSP0717-20131115/6175_1 /ASSEMBLY_ACC=CAM_ASM_000666 /TAXON_ID=230516 /ORGANISM="Chaetoceros curvisetus" /LENGTH=213 /DNA_ID=CAMNT_0051634101 /DNA_START=281 /DNA_END=922 /DNA_ORIENTATION=-